MDSLNLYRQRFSQCLPKYTTPVYKLSQLSSVFKEVCHELNKTPFKLENSTFVVSILNSIQHYENNNSTWNDKDIVIFDAFIIVCSVKKFFTIPNYRFDNDEIIQANKENFFHRADYSQYENDWIKKIEDDLNEISSYLSNRYSQDFGHTQQTGQVNYFQADETPSTKTFGYMENYQINQFGVLTTQNLNPTLPPTNFNSQNPIAPVTQNLNSSYYSRNNQDSPPIAIPSKSQEKISASTRIEDYSAQKALYDKKIEFQKLVAETEKERTERAKIHIQDNLKKNEAWYAEQKNILEQVKKLQEPTQELLTAFRSFSNNLTENYVLKFTNSLIALFNSIADNYDSHKDKAQNSQNNDYSNAVANYQDYMDDIKDTLADFGVQEISSTPGTKFEGKIHVAKNTKNFSPQTATIKKSLRTGFIYKEIVLQKESVEV